MQQGGTKKSRRDNVYRAIAHEQKFVRNTRDPAYRIASSKPVDAIVFRANGIVELVDCKLTYKDSFVINYKDIEKGLKTANRLWQKGFQARFVIEMNFVSNRKSRKIIINDTDVGMSIKAWVAGKKIMTKRVAR